VWAISVADPSRGTAQSRKREVVLGTIIPRTGGLRIPIVRSSGLPNQLKAIANSLVSQYMIQFVRPAGELEQLKIDTPKGMALATMFAQ
jgi:hypothetical protein